MCSLLALSVISDTPESWTGHCLGRVFCAVYLLCQQCVILQNSELVFVFGECFVQSTCCVNSVWYSWILNWSLSSASVLCSPLAVSTVSVTPEFWTGLCLRRVFCAVHLLCQQCPLLRNSELDVVLGECSVQSTSCANCRASCVIRFWFVFLRLDGANETLPWVRNCVPRNDQQPGRLQLPLLCPQRLDTLLHPHHTSKQLFGCC